VLSVVELTSYVEVMRALGVSTFKSDGTEIALVPRPEAAPPADDKPAPRTAPVRLTNEQLLFACTEGLPEDEVG
jgi:hypothetical protein